MKGERESMQDMDSRGKEKTFIQSQIIHQRRNINYRIFLNKFD